VVEHPVQLVDGARAERVAHLGPVEGDAHRSLAHGTVIRDVVEVETVDRFPRGGIEER
jgi:hypothetical protein